MANISMLKRCVLAIIVLLGLVQAWDHFTHRPIARPDGVLVATEPLQTAVVDSGPLAFREFILTPLAKFSLHGRVLLVSRYRLGREAALAPYDLGVGWLRMSDSGVLRGLSLSQSARFLHWRWRDAPPIPEAEITSSAANIHLIPASHHIASRIAALRPGQLVSLQGRLVEASRADGWRWRSSLSRTDSGSGACELLYVEDIEAEGDTG
ncbi:MAG: hypothetical protein WBN86_02975 [Porticoccaceae bacterium]